MKHKLVCSVGAVVAVVLCWGGLAFGQNAPPWDETFEDYDVGDKMCGRGGWQCWDQVPTVDARVVDDPAHGGQRSVKIAKDNEFDSDIIAVFKDDNGNYLITEGRWELIAWVYVPSSPNILNSGFIVQNLYNDGGPYAWSVQLRFNNVTNLVLSEFDGATLPLIEDEWVRIRVEIDLDADDPNCTCGDGCGSQKCYYGDDLLYDKPWNGGVGACGPAIQFASIDLWAAGTPAVYYDDLSMISLGGPDVCQYKIKKNSKAKRGCPRDACPKRGDLFASGEKCSELRDCKRKIKIKRLDCPEGERGFCKKVKGKRVECKN